MKKFTYLSILMLLEMAVMLPQVLKAAAAIGTHVTSFGTYDFSGKHFCILSNMENISSDDVEFKEYAKYISYAFQIKGGIEVPSQSEKVEVCILLSYDIKDASYIRTVSEPVWGNTSVSSVTTSTDFLGNPRYNYHYNRGVVGYTQSEQKVNLYNRYIDLFAYEISTKEGAEHKMVWKAYVKSQGSWDNLYKVFPAMTYTMFDYIGTTIADGFKKVNDEQYSCSYYYDIRYEMFKEKNPQLKNLVFHGRFWGKNAGVEYIYFNSNSTVVRIILSAKKKLFKNTYIESNHQKYYCKTVKNCSGRELPMDNNEVFFNKQKYSSAYFELFFPSLPGDVQVVDIISQKKENESSKDDIVIKNIHLKN